MLKAAREIDNETQEMMQAIIRGEHIDWQENPNSWVRIKKGIS